MTMTTPGDFLSLLRVYATKVCTHSNTLAARAKKAGIRNGKIDARMATNLHTASLLLREASERLAPQCPKPASAPPAADAIAAIRDEMLEFHQANVTMTLARGCYYRNVPPLSDWHTRLGQFDERTIAASAQVREVEPWQPAAAGDRALGRNRGRPAPEPVPVAQGDAKRVAEIEDLARSVWNEANNLDADGHNCDAEMLRTAAGVLRQQQATIADLEASLAACRADAERLDALRDNSWDLRCFDTFGGEDIGWKVMEHHQAEPLEREVAVVFTDDPRAAIDAAKAVLPLAGESQ